MTYAMPTNITNAIGIAAYANSVTDYFFWPLILFAVFAILFFSFMGWGATRAFGGASFVTAILAILMAVMGLISTYVLVGCVLLAGIAFVCMYAANHREY